MTPGEKQMLATLIGMGIIVVVLVLMVIGIVELVMWLRR